MNKNIVLAGALILAVVGAGAWAAMTLIGHLQNTSASVARKAGTPIPVRLGTAEKGEIEEVIGLEGIVKQSQVLPVQAETSGQILAMPVRLGDQVRRGAPIATLDASVQTANLVNARMKVGNAQEQLRMARTKSARLAGLLKEGLITEDEVEKALVDKVKAEDTLSEAQARLSNAVKELAATRIVAPASGIVSTLDQVAGVVTKPYVNLLTLSVIDPVHFEVGLNEEKLRAVHVGQTVEISFHAFPGRKHQGTVVLIKPVVDEKTRLMTVVIRVDNANLSLMPGMRGLAVIANKSAGLRIPGVALMSPREDTAEVFVVDKDNVAHLRPVKTGLQGGGGVEIREGLAAGDRVVIVGQAGLRDNDKVRIGDEYAPQ